MLYDENMTSRCGFWCRNICHCVAAVVGDARDDGADAQMLRVVLVGECFDRGSQQLIALCVRGNESAVDHLARPRCAGIQRHFELLTPLPPVDRLCDLEISE